MKGEALPVAILTLGRWTMLTKLIGCWNKNGTVQKALRMAAAQLIPLDPLKVGAVGAVGAGQELGAPLTL